MKTYFGSKPNQSTLSKEENRIRKTILDCGFSVKYLHGLFCKSSSEGYRLMETVGSRLDGGDERRMGRRGAARQNSKASTVVRHGRRRSMSARLETRPMVHDFRHGGERRLMRAHLATDGATWGPNWVLAPPSDCTLQVCMLLHVCN